MRANLPHGGGTMPAMGGQARELAMEAIDVPYPVPEISELARRRREPLMLARELELVSKGIARERPEVVMNVVRGYVHLVRAWLFGEGSTEEALAMFRSASEVIERHFPELSRLSGFFSRLPEDEKREILREYALRVAEAIRRNRDAFREAVRRELADDPEEPWILIYYDALMRHYQIVGRLPESRELRRWPAEAILYALAAYSSVLLGYLAGEVDARTFSWVYSDLVSSIGALPTPPPKDLGLAEAVLEAVARFAKRSSGSPDIPRY
ncbi:MAG: hypothetical protein ACP5LG_07775 [Conexivisphaera sp.]